MAITSSTKRQKIEPLCVSDPDPLSFLPISKDLRGTVREFLYEPIKFNSIEPRNLGDKVLLKLGGLDKESWRKVVHLFHNNIIYQCPNNRIQFDILEKFRLLVPKSISQLRKKNTSSREFKIKLKNDPKAAENMILNLLAGSPAFDEPGIMRNLDSSSKFGLQNQFLDYLSRFELDHVNDPTMTQWILQCAINLQGLHRIPLFMDRGMIAHVETLPVDVLRMAIFNTLYETQRDDFEELMNALLAKRNESTKLKTKIDAAFFSDHSKQVPLLANIIRNQYNKCSRDDYLDLTKIVDLLNWYWQNFPEHVLWPIEIHDSDVNQSCSGNLSLLPRQGMGVLAFLRDEWMRIAIVEHTDPAVRALILQTPLLKYLASIKSHNSENFEAFYEQLRPLLLFVDPETGNNLLHYIVQCQNSDFLSFLNSKKYTDAGIFQLFTHQNHEGKTPL